LHSQTDCWICHLTVGFATAVHRWIRHGSSPLDLPRQFTVGFVGVGFATPKIYRVGFATRCPLPCKMYGAWDPQVAGSVPSPPSIAHLFDGMQHNNEFVYNCRAQALLRYQYPEAVLHLGEQAGDLTRLRLQDVPLGDILMAGPPCLGWAGKHHHRFAKFFVANHVKLATS